MTKILLVISLLVLILTMSGCEARVGRVEEHYYENGFKKTRLTDIDTGESFTSSGHVGNCVGDTVLVALDGVLEVR